MTTTLKKILSFSGALIVISMITFLLTKLTSVNPAENYLRISKIAISKEAIENAREYLGLNKPWLDQYWDWFINVLKGDFGTSYVYRSPVLPLVLDKFLATLQLSILSFVLIIVTALPIGIFSGIYKGSLFDKIIRLLSFASVSLPNFWLGYLLMIIFSVHLKWLPVSGADSSLSFVLPTITLSYPLIGQYIALIRKIISLQMESRHTQNALLRGVTIPYIIYNHLIPNALPSLLTSLSLSGLYLMTGSVIIEEVFAWQGIGHLFVHALRTIDTPVIQACMLLFGLLFLANNLLSKWLGDIADPRILRNRKEVL